MINTVRIAVRITAANLRAAMRYRADFVISVLLGLVWQSSTLLFAYVLLSRFDDGLGGLAATGILLLIGIRLCAHGLYVLGFSNLWRIPILVDQGLMDAYFLRPLSVLAQVLLSFVNVNALGDLAAGVVTLGIAMNLVEVDWTVALIGYVVAAVLGGCLIEAAFQVLVACLLLRSPSSRILGGWVDELMSTFGNFPLTILPKATQFIFTFVLPVAFVAYFPAVAVLGLTPEDGMMAILVPAAPLAGPLFFTASLWVWRRSLRTFVAAGG